MTILLATNNAHKVDELRAVLHERFSEITIVRPSDLGIELDVEEDALTLEGNAYRKAIAFHLASGLACIADDTGLEVDALNGAPGVHSARFAGAQASYADNCALLLQHLDGVAATDRSARFRTVLCYVDEWRTEFAEGVCNGKIRDQARGDNGFGYDPLFVPEGHVQSFAQMDAALKNSISHRGRALQNLARRFGEYRLYDNDELSGAPPSFVKHDPHRELRALLCEAAVLAVSHRNEELRVLLDRYTKEHHDVGLMYETLLQIYLFAGFPAALEALSTLRSVLESDAEAWYAEEDEAYDLRLFLERGAKTCQRIYTTVYTSMRERVSQLSSHLDSWMIVEGYGKVLSRERLDLLSRELVNVAVLAWSGWERQLLSHLRGALNVGATDEECRMALDIASRYSTEELQLRADAVWKRLRSSSTTS